MSKIIGAVLAAVLTATFSAAQQPSDQLWSTGLMGAEVIVTDAGTGAVTIVGSTGHAGTAPLAFHPDGTIYSFTQTMTADPAVLEQLATIDAATGAATLVGSPLPQRTRIMALVVAPDGSILGAGLMGAYANKLLAIDRATGQPTIVGPFVNAANMMDFTYDSAGDLYGANQASLYRINAESGEATKVADFGGDLIVGGASRVMGIHFTQEGTLYATDFVSAALGNSSLYTVNPLTGQATRVTGTGVAQVHSADMRPPSPADRFATLAARVGSYAQNDGIERSLDAKLEGAAALFDGGAPLVACDLLGAFDNEVRALADNKLTSQQAAQLLLDSTWAKTALGCQP